MERNVESQRMLMRFRHRWSLQQWVAVAMIALLLTSVGRMPLGAQSGTDAFPRAASIGTTGLPIPRFVSLKSDRVQIRQGPGTDHKVLWVFSRVGLPLEVIQEYENWR